jgi:hypothetical protein
MSPAGEAGERRSNGRLLVADQEERDDRSGHCQTGGSYQTARSTRLADRARDRGRSSHYNFLVLEPAPLGLTIALATVAQAVQWRPVTGIGALPRARGRVAFRRLGVGQRT